jgi:hypothetical protein
MNFQLNVPSDWESLAIVSRDEREIESWEGSERVRD